MPNKGSGWESDFCFNVKKKLKPSAVGDSQLVPFLVKFCATESMDFRSSSFHL